MKLLCAVDENWAIGKDNKLLFNIADDLRRFRDLTLNNTIVMGRKTLESLPGGQPLKGRKNIVLTRNLDYTMEGITIYHSREDLLINLDRLEKEAEVFLIGGEDIVRQMLDRCNGALITMVFERVADADRKIPNLDWDPNFKLVDSSEEFISQGLSYKYLEYKRI